ncbi:MAG: glycosyltransferase, partial [Burkholderiaceae bacterium]|nr:glycosyltransferase [Burkholderiaceae bacterium]
MADALAPLIRERAIAWGVGLASPAEIDAVRRLREMSSVAERIVLQGHRRDLGSLMTQAEVLVLPSQGQESFGYTVVEAMA